MERIHPFSNIDFVKWTQEQACRLHNEDMAMLELAISDPFSVPHHLILRSIAWLRDKEVSVRKKTKEKLLKLYHSYCKNLCECRTGNQFVDHLELIPPRLIAYTIDEDCDEDKTLNVEAFILDGLFPDFITSEQVVYHWMKFFLYMPLSQRSFLEIIILEKQRFMNEMNDYIKEMNDDMELIEEKKKNATVKIRNSFSKMSKFFRNPDEALEGFHVLHQMHNHILFRELSTMLTFYTDLENSRECQIFILEQFGNDDYPHGFLKKLLVKCSSSIFRYEHVGCISIILFESIVHMLDKYRHLHLSSFDIPCAIDLLVMILDLYPESLKYCKKRFLNLFSVEDSKQSEMLLQMLSRLGHRLPIKFSDFDLRPFMGKGTPESIYAVAALQSMGAPITSEGGETQTFKPFSEDMDMWNRAMSDPFSVSLLFVLQAKEWIRHKEVSLRRKTKEKLLNVYHSYCLKLFQGDCPNQSVDHLERIPSILISYAIDEDLDNFGTMNVELLISEELFPDCITFDHVMYHWMKFFLYMSVYQRRFLESVILEKKRFQKEVKNYLEIREMGKKDFSDAVLEKVCDSFLKMSGFFGNFYDAVDSFRLLHQMNDNEFFTELSQLLHKDTCFEKSRLFRRSIMARIGDKHPVHDFLKILLLRCSYSIFFFDHVKYIHLVLTNGSFGEVNRNKIWNVSLFDVHSVIQLLLIILSGYPEFLEYYKGKFAKVEDGVPTDVLQMLASAYFLLAENICQEGTSVGPVYAGALTRPMQVPILFDDIKMLHGGIQSCDREAEDVDLCDQDTAIGPRSKIAVHVVDDDSFSLVARWKRKSDEAPADVSSKRSVR